MAELPDTETSFWREFYPGPLYPQIKEDLETDVVVVGAGITGLTAAYMLKRSGKRVAVLEKDTVGGGTTGRTTGKVTAQHSITYYNLQHRLGRETARLYGEANTAAVAQIDEIVRRENIGCDWQRDDNYVFTTDPKRVATFKQEADAAADLGLPASFETVTDLPFEVKGAVKFAGQGKFNAQKYLLGLAKAVSGDGSHIFEQSNVIGIRDGNPCHVRTRHAKVIAKDIIVATSVPTMPLMARGGYCILEYPTESFLIAGKPRKQIRGMYISPDKQHYSIFPIEIDGEPVLLVGGEGGNLPGLRLRKKVRYQRLADYAARHFGIKTVTNCWGDRDYIAYDNVPLIGKAYPWSKHLYLGSAYRKWGLSSGTVAGIILHDLITGKDNAWSHLYTPNRLKPIKSIPRGVIQYLKK